MSLRVRFAVIMVLILVLFCLDLVATKFYLYWSFEWLDNLMHVFGGFLAGNMVLIGRQVVARKKGEDEISKKSLFFVAILGGLLVGTLWELIEYLFGVSHLGPRFVWDTFVDLIMDMVGAASAYITWIKIPHKPYTTA
ncbi:MAG: hypothetical protein V4664_02255 [Patescibacteria group bacterium]